MWILKNSKDLLDNLKSRSFSQVSSIKTFDFSTLYTTLPHDKLKINRLEEGHNSYPLVCRRPAETVSLQRRQICYRWGTPAYWSLVPRSSMFYKYCETVYSRSGINHMWILKNSKDLLDNLKSRSFSQVSSIKTFDFSTRVLWSLGIQYK
jgi:hypothetical protein